MGEIFDSVQGRIKGTTTGVFLLVFRTLFGAFLGLTFALVGDRAIQYGDFSFAFVIVLTTLLFLRLSRRWRTPTVLVFSLICVLIGLLLRMYILVAPGQ